MTVGCLGFAVVVATHCGSDGPCEADCVGAACGGDGDCSPDTYCHREAGNCQPRYPLGATCQASHACQGGSCVDGVCCDAACDGYCESCDQLGHEGTCTPIPVGTDSWASWAAWQPSTCRARATWR